MELPSHWNGCFLKEVEYKKGEEMREEDERRETRIAPYNLKDQQSREIHAEK